MGHAFELRLLITLHIRHLGVDRLLLALRLTKCPFSRAAAGFLGVVTVNASMRHNTCQTAAVHVRNSSPTRRRASPRTAFRARMSMLFGREDSQALHTLFSHFIPFCPAPYHNTRPDLLRRSQTKRWTGESSVPARLVKARRTVSPRMRSGAKPSNCAKRKEAECQELFKAGMSEHGRCESVSCSVPLGFCIARTDKSWTCESKAPPFANASGSVVRVFFCCGGVGGARSAAAVRAASPPPAALVEHAPLRSPPPPRLRPRPGPRVRGPAGRPSRPP